MNLYGAPPPSMYQYGAPPPPAKSRMSPVAILAVFIGVLLGLAVLAGIFVFATQPPAPIAPCPPGVPCAPPRPSLPPIAEQSPLPSFTPLPSLQPTSKPTPIPTAGPTGQPSSSPGQSPAPTDQPATPEPTGGPVATPSSDSPPAMTGELWTSPTLGYSFEYDTELFELTTSEDDLTVFAGKFFDAQVVISATDEPSSPRAVIDRQLGVVDTFLIARAPDTDEYDALLGPSIGYIRGEGGVFSGTLLSSDGTPVAPGTVVVMAATDGRLTVSVVLIVANPDVRLGEDTMAKAVRGAADEFLKTFDWGTP